MGNRYRLVESADRWSSCLVRNKQYEFFVTVNRRSNSCRDTQEGHESTRSHDLRCTRMPVLNEIVCGIVYIQRATGCQKMFTRAPNIRIEMETRRCIEVFSSFMDFVTGFSPRYAAA